jgi:hypothetical protein
LNPTSQMQGKKKADGMGMPSAGSHTHGLRRRIYQARTSTTLSE